MFNFIIVWIVNYRKEMNQNNYYYFKNRKERIRMQLNVFTFYTVVHLGIVSILESLIGFPLPLTPPNFRRKLNNENAT